MYLPETHRVYSIVYLRLLPILFKPYGVALLSNTFKYVSFQYVIFERTFHKHFVRTELYINVFITIKVKGQLYERLEKSF